MNKKTNIILIILCFILIITFFNKYFLLSSLIYDISKIFLIKVFPFLFIMMVINNILINLNLPAYFKNSSLYIFIMSILSGSPINAVILSDFLEKKQITEEKASIILAFTTFNNPLFLYNYFNLIFKNNFIIIKLFIFIYLLNIIIFIFFYKKVSTKISYVAHKINIGKIIITSIKKAGENILNIYFIITFFYLITSLIIVNNNVFTPLIKGLIEITTGLDSLININLTVKIKELYTLIILLFSGLSIQMQISIILEKYNINYKYFYITRILFIFSSLLVLLF